MSHNGEPNRRLPWTVADASEIKGDMNSSCEECGLMPLSCESAVAVETTYRLFGPGGNARSCFEHDDESWGADHGRQMEIVAHTANELDEIFRAA